MIWDPESDGGADDLHDGDHELTAAFEYDQIEPSASPPPTRVFARQPLAVNVRWVWMAGWAMPAVLASITTLGLAMFVFDVPPASAVFATLAVMAVLAWLITRSRYRNWSWMLDETELIIDHGIVFKLTRVIPRIRVQHVVISSGPIDRFLGLRQVSIFTAGTREADAKIPGLAEDTAEELRRALIQH